MIEHTAYHMPGVFFEFGFSRMYYGAFEKTLQDCLVLKIAQFISEMSNSDDDGCMQR